MARRFAGLNFAIVVIGCLYLLSGAFFIFGVVKAYQQHRSNNKAVQRSQQSSTTPGSIPSNTELPPDSFANHHVPADAPRYIFIPEISVKATVVSVGLTSEGNIGSPNNIFQAGWFGQSAKPGQTGATVIDGHVSSWSTPGVFANLKSLRPGSVVQIERGDGELLTYKVSRIQSFDDNSVDMQSVMNPINSSKSGLNLITCAGRVKKGTNEFDKRLVIYTEQI